MSKVYFIKPKGLEGPIKIGCSFSPDNRRRTLETWSPFALEIIAEVSGGFHLERQFHALFAQWHERREWFTATPELLAVIASIQEGAFDASTLPAPKRLAANKSALGAAQRASWTPERRIRASYNARVRHTQLRTRSPGALRMNIPQILVAWLILSLLLALVLGASIPRAEDDPVESEGFGGWGGDIHGQRDARNQDCNHG